MYLLYSLCLVNKQFIITFYRTESVLFLFFFHLCISLNSSLSWHMHKVLLCHNSRKFYKPNTKKYLQNVLSVRNYGDLESFGIYLVHPTLSKTVCNLRRLVTTFIDSVFQHEFIYVFMSIFELRASWKTYYWPISKSRFLCWNLHLHMRLEYLNLISGSCMYFQIILT